MQALIEGAWQLGLLNQRQRTYLYKCLSEKGWRKQESAHAYGQYGEQVEHRKAGADRRLPGQGMSIRSTVHVTGPAKNTVTKLLVDLGQACADYQDGC